MKNEDSKEPLPLGYLAPQDDLELRKRCQGQRFGGAVIACVTVIMAVAIFFLRSLALIHTLVPRTPHDRMIVVLSSLSRIRSWPPAARIGAAFMAWSKASTPAVTPPSMSFD